MDFPTLPPLPLFVHTWSVDNAGEVLWLNQAVAIASITWPVANTAFYVPVALPCPYPVKRVFWINGSTASLNMDFGIYTADGTLIYSTGSTAASGTSAPQYVTPTEFLLAPGRYYFGLACSNTTANAGGQGNTSQTVGRLRLAGVLQQATALPLPATMTPAAVANSCLPICGVTRTASGF